jgi:predicted DNA-binding protein
MHGVIERRRRKETGSATVDDGPLTLKISPRLNRALTKVAAKSGKPKHYHVRRALERYVEDTWDILRADEALRSSRRTYSSAEVKKHLGLAD